MDKQARGEKKRSPKHIALVILCTVLVYLLAVSLAAFVIDQRTVRFYMSGPEEMELGYKEAYSEPGIYAVTNGRIFGETEKHLKIESSNDIDSSKLGEYEVNYTAKFLFKSYSTQRKVKVVDKIAPVLELKYDDSLKGSWLSGYQEEGYTATDDYDGDITDRVESRQEPGRIVYTVKDSSGNETKMVREPIAALATPELKLFGGTDMTVQAGMSWEDPGYSMVDAQGNDISEHIRVTGEVIPYLAGTYQLEYSITNTVGETVTAHRNVTVLPAKAQENNDPNTPTIYLTFDDGPGPYTSKLLDVLAKYGAKATFFVTGAYPKYFDQIGRAYSEGHSIGVHTYSHDYRKIYSSEDAFFQDFNAVEELIMQQTGSYTYLCRFPGGSSNTVSRFNPGIMSRLTAAMDDMGYKYFDWNVSSGDAGETTDTDQVAKNVINGCAGRKVSVVLQHDIKDFSVAAMDQILSWGTANGYSFKALTVDSPGAHHGVNN